MTSGRGSDIVLDLDAMMAGRGNGSSAAYPSRTASPTGGDKPWSELVVPAGALTGREPRPADWLTAKFIERGELVLVTAPPGKMKSLLFLYWATCLAAGRPFVPTPEGEGGRGTKACGVLWVNTDKSQDTHEDRLAAVMRGLGLADWNIPLYSLRVTNFTLALADHAAQLIGLAGELQADVIVIDTLSASLPGVDENSAKDMTGPLANLRWLASDGRTCLVIHHPNKADADGYRGSGTIGGRFDRHITLTRDGMTLEAAIPKQNNTPAEPLTARARIVNEPETDALVSVSFYADGPTARERGRDELREKVLDALFKVPSGLSRRKLTDAVGGRWDAIKAALDKLIGDGLVVREKGARDADIYRRLGILNFPDTPDDRLPTTVAENGRETVRETVENTSPSPASGRRSRARKAQ